MIDIIHRIGIRAPIADVYRAVATVDGVAGWWTKETTGESNVGDTVTVAFVDDGVEKGHMDLDILRLDPSKEVLWRVTAGPPEWVGTDIGFNLSQEGEHTIVLFGHRNWREAVEFTAHCSMKWATFLLSLRDFVESGKGSPAPDDVKIDNWN